MSITVANFITQYLRPALASTSDFSDATLGYWIDAALLDLSRSFPRILPATWTTAAGDHNYDYSASTTAADETNIIRILNCYYPWGPTIMGVAVDQRYLIRKSHYDTDFNEGDFYDPDNDAQILYFGPVATAGQFIYSECHCYWLVAAGTFYNPPEHYELIRLFVIWQAFLHQTADLANSPVPNPSLLNANALQAARAERAYRAAYQKLEESQATSGVTTGWIMDKWDRNNG